MSRSSSVTRQSNFDIPFLFTLPVGALRQHAPLADRHVRLLLLSTWGYSRDNLAQVCEVVPETMRALLARIRRRAEPFLVSNSFADSHKALRQFRWRVDVRGEDRTAWRRTATLRVRSQAAKQPSHVVKHARPARGVSSCSSGLSQ